ncbi:MAG: Ldh family oxidoreductase [Candidatus Dormiibacterota bacterium]
MDLELHVEAVRIPVTRVREFCRAAVHAIGFAEPEADLVTQALVTGSLRSHPGQGQGVQQLPRYLARVRSGVVRPRAELRVRKTGGATALIDADRAAGSIAASRAMDLAVELAKRQGVGVVAVRDSTHLGVVSHYAMRALSENCIGLAFTNAGPEIAPWGGTRATVGTNPWAVAVPTAEPWPIVLDMANSTAGKGMVRWFEQAGLPIPDDWALTVDGQRTTDPAAAMLGTLFPLGGPKGYAMAVIVDALTGVLAGAHFGLSCFALDHQDVGHLMIALDINAFTTYESFLSRITQLIKEIRDTPLAAGTKKVWLPGELEHARSEEREQNGIPFERGAYQGLLDLANVLDLERSTLEPIP